MALLLLLIFRMDKKNNNNDNAAFGIELIFNYQFDMQNNWLIWYLEKKVWFTMALLQLLIFRMDKKSNINF